jgi:hypothetical protein
VLVFELLLDTAVEEEGDVRVLLGFCIDETLDKVIRGARWRLACDVALLDALLGEPFSQDVGHTGRRESDRERELGVVPGHGGDVLEMEIIRRGASLRDRVTCQVVGNSDLHGLVRKTENRDDLSNTVGSVVECEQGVAAYGDRQSQSSILIRTTYS